MNHSENIKTRDLILVVDDQPVNLKVIASVLGKEYALSIANSGHNAIKILENNTPDLILLDVMMPEMDGFEVCQLIKANERTKHIPVIFLTAKTDIDDVVKGFQCGAVDYIAKPFSSTEVKARVQNHLNLKHALDELKIANDRLNELNATKDKFFSIIAHDLRTPFTSIVALSEMLVLFIKEKNYEGIEEYAGLIEQSSNHAMDLLSNLLAWARSQTGRIEFKPEKLNLSGLLNETAQMFDQIAMPKNITIVRNYTENLEVFADKQMIGTVLRNLISNAIKFTRPGGEISLLAKPEPDHMMVTVSDTGVGISEERLKKLFRIEYNESTYGTANEKGTGLGLILCKEFMEKHDGRIWAESESGKGSAFCFSLPLSGSTEIG